MASRPLGHGSTSPVAPFGSDPSSHASLVAAHGADLLHTISVEANAWAGDVEYGYVITRIWKTGVVITVQLPCNYITV